MALILGLKKDSVFYIDDTPVRTLSTSGHEQVRLGIGEEVYTITDKEAIEIRPEVFVSMGLPQHKKDGMLSRIVIEAPRRIVILRQELYDKHRSKDEGISDPAEVSE